VRWMWSDAPAPAYPGSQRWRARVHAECARVLTFRVLAVLWIVWAYTPDWVLKSLGITYYPDRYWAIALPMYAMSLVVYLVIIYNAWNLCNTNPFESYYTVRGTCWRLVDRKLACLVELPSVCVRYARAWGSG
jgi:hypothetical protein